MMIFRLAIPLLLTLRLAACAAPAATTAPAPTEPPAPAPTQPPEPEPTALASPAPAQTSEVPQTSEVSTPAQPYALRESDAGPALMHWDGDAGAWEILLPLPPDLAQTLDPTQIEDVSLNDALTLATITFKDGKTITLSQNLETGQWQEQTVYRQFSELDPANETEMQVIQKAVEDSLAGGVFMGPEEIAEKIANGELAVVKDEATGAVMVFTKQALEYIKEQGQTIETSDFARLYQRAYTVNGKYDPAYMDENFRKQATAGPDALQSWAEKIHKLGGFIPLPPEWMTLVTRVNEQNKPELVAVLPPDRFIDLMKFFWADWVRLQHYPSKDGRLYKDPTMKVNDRKGNAALAIVINEAEEEERIFKKRLTEPYRPHFRWMHAVVDETGKLSIEDEFKTITHDYDGENWQELAEYRMPDANATQRLAQALVWEVFNKKEFTTNANATKLTIHENVLGLNKEEVTRFIQLTLGRPDWQPGDDFHQDKEKALPWQAALEQAKAETQASKEEGESALVIAPDAQGNPAFIINSGGEYGLNPEFTQAALIAIKRINKVSPDSIHKMTAEGAKFLSANTALIDVQGDPIRASSNDYSSIIVLDQTGVQNLSFEELVLKIMDLWLSEGIGEVVAGRHLVNNGQSWIVGGKLNPDELEAKMAKDNPDQLHFLKKTKSKNGVSYWEMYSRVPIPQTYGALVELLWVRGRAIASNYV